MLSDINNFLAAELFYCETLVFSPFEYKLISVRVDIISEDGVDGGDRGCQDPMAAAPLDDFKVPIRHHYAIWRFCLGHVLTWSRHT